MTTKEKWESSIWFHEPTEKTLASMGIKCLIFKFEIAHVGWELDNEAWVVRMLDDSVQIILTSLGSPYVASLKEVQRLLSMANQRFLDLNYALQSCLTAKENA